MTRILIADPDAASRKALALLLSHRLGVSDIAEAGDAETLLRDLSESASDLLLLDWKLYGAPAPETCRLLYKAYPMLKIVLLSVNAEDEQAARSAGAAFVHKGASPETVVAVLEQLLKAKPDRT
jgi:DNA-binding NarL/FixJ family response regulator